MAAELMDVEKSWKSCYEATETLPAAFKQSKWVTRGWTLQELLAPKEVLFLNRQWMHFGTKSALADEIETFTDIHETTLRHARGSCDLKYVSLAQKTCLASTRTTSRVEDIAYCLLALFDVNLPLLYGEGRKAFRRLQEEILRTSADESLFARHLKEVRWKAAGRSLLAESLSDFRGLERVSADNSLILRDPSVIVNQMLQMRVFSLNMKLKELDLRTDRDNSKLVPIGCQMGKGELALLLHCCSDRNTLFVAV